MDDKPIEEMTNQELAECLRESGGCQDEALARLLEADVKNHDANVNSMDKWRELLLEAVLAFSFYMNRPGDEEAIGEARVVMTKCAQALDMPIFP